MKRKNVAIGTALAAGAGYLVGVLTAPKSGRETRKDIRTAAAKAKAEAEQKLKATHSELTELIEEANKKITASKTKVTKEVRSALDQAEAARQKARELLSAIHEGEAEDHDLKHAVEEAKDSVKHLKKYLGKKTSN